MMGRQTFAHTDQVQLRDYDEHDQDAIDRLIDAGSDPLWVAQGHTLHGPAIDDGPRWRRTLVAEVDGRVIGAATVATNRVHTREYNLAVEVASEHRQTGVATALIAATRDARRDPLEMAAKVRPDDAAGVALLRHFAGRITQTCAGMRPDPCSDEIASWCHAVTVPTYVEVRPLGDISSSERERVWIEQYLWVHESWAPADRAGLESLAAQLVSPVDVAASSIAVRDGVVEAIAWAFDEDDGSFGVGAETATRDVVAGDALVAAVLARTLLQLRERGCRSVEIDGHDGDPHLAPVLATLPPCASAPLWLVAIA
jgi:GNAT superfamily N-acetyltransferase